jgi:AraC family transcriptional regulator of adaptative response / DNA-3-methyladenine glycosylase II
VRLILDGALDGPSEVELGARLGVSARHLRRLFSIHLGVTPDGLARSARAHFARRLLDDTDLTITQIAFASGFGSLRQFNRACQEIFRASPRMLRARRRKSDRLAADGGLALRLAFNGPLDWEAMLGHFAAQAIPGVEHVDGTTYRRTIVIGGDPGVLELLPGGDDYLVLRAHLPHWEELIHVVDRARRIASLDFALETASRRLVRDAAIAPLLRARPGVRPPGTWDAFETGVRAIVGQQVTVAASARVTGRLVQRLGDPVPGLGQLGLTQTFPSPETVAAADLTGLGLPRTRSDAVRSFAGAVADDVIRLDGSMTLDQLVGAVTGVDGLGPWTAHYLALRLGEPDACPATDLALRQALAPHIARSGRTLREVTERWRPWRALATAHLWTAARPGELRETA